MSWWAVVGLLPLAGAASMARAQLPFDVPKPAAPTAANLFASQCGTCHTVEHSAAPRQGPNWPASSCARGHAAGVPLLGRPRARRIRLGRRASRRLAHQSAEADSWRGDAISPGRSGDSRQHHRMAEGAALMAKPIHSMIRVLDEARSVDFYRRAFGMQMADRFDFDGFTLVYLAAEAAASSSS